MPLSILAAVGLHGTSLLVLSICFACPALAPSVTHNPINTRVHCPDSFTLGYNGGVAPVTLPLQVGLGASCSAMTLQISTKSEIRNLQLHTGICTSAPGLRQLRIIALHLSMLEMAIFDRGQICFSSSTVEAVKLCIACKPSRQLLAPSATA